MTVWLWIGFLAFIAIMLALDLFVINRKSHEIRVREALGWTAVCVALALGFNVLVYFIYENHWLGIGLNKAGGEQLDGRDAAVQFFTGWLVEYSLSVDNIFVIAVIFAYFRVPRELQHRVLVWGVLGALLMRGAMIGAGTALIHRFHWMIYVFAGILLLTAVRMLIAGDEDPDPERGLVLRVARRLLTISPNMDGQKFFTRLAAGSPPDDPNGPPGGALPAPPPLAAPNGAGRWAVTPLFLVLLVVETTDVIFAVDSIPAIIGITQDSFLVFTSNIFAILGLRSLYFALAAVIDTFRYLKLALVFVLAFVGVKMFLDGTPTEISTEISLGVIGFILGVGVVASRLAGRARTREDTPASDLTHAAELAWKRARRTVILVVGVTIVVLSVPIGLLPGPGGIAVAFLGLGILATEFVWAQRLLTRVRDHAGSLAAHTEAALVPRKPRVWMVLLAWAILAGGIAALCLRFPDHRGVAIAWSFGPAAALGWWTVMVFRRWRNSPKP